MQAQLSQVMDDIDSLIHYYFGEVWSLYTSCPHYFGAMLSSPGLMMKYQTVFVWSPFLIGIDVKRSPVLITTFWHHQLCYLKQMIIGVLSSQFKDKDY